MRDMTSTQNELTLLAKPAEIIERRSSSSMKWTGVEATLASDEVATVPLPMWADEAIAPLSHAVAEPMRERAA